MSSMKRILVCKLRHHGDVLLTTPVFTQLKKAYPEAHIDAYIYKDTHPMLEHNPDIDGYLLYDKKMKKAPKLKKLFYEYQLLREIKKRSYDMVINLTEGDRGALAASVSKAKVRVGYDPEGSGMRGKKKCYTHMTRICHGMRHTVERHLDVVRTLGIFPKIDERDLTFVIPQQEKDSLKALLEMHDIQAGQFLLFHPVSRWLFKCLPEKTMADVISYFSRKGYKIVLSASKDPLEMQMNRKIAELSGSENILDLSGKTSLKQLGALIELSKLLICVDSVPLHMASALKAPVLALFGPTSEKNWAPWNNPNARVFKKDFICRPCYMPGCGGSQKSDCLEAITAIDIIKEAEYLMQSMPLRMLQSVKSSPR